jgi:hypothetical protein
VNDAPSAPQRVNAAFGKPPVAAREFNAALGSSTSSSGDEPRKIPVPRPVLQASAGVCWTNAGRFATI